MTTELATVDNRGLVIKTPPQLLDACTTVTQSGLCPKAYYGKPRDAFIASLCGMKHGWDIMQSLQYIAVVNGRPSMWGDGPIGLVQGSGTAEYIREWWELSGQEVSYPAYGPLKDWPDGLTACFQAKRKDASQPNPIARFSVADAKRAGLWGKCGTWSSYPQRMLVLRARAFGLRDGFQDALQGITQAEEWQDIQPTHTPSRLEQIAAPQLPAPEPIDAEPDTEPEAVSADWCAKFRARVAAKRADLESSLDDEGFISAVACDWTGNSPTPLEELTQASADEMAARLAAGDYCWETGERVPPAAPTGDEIHY